MSRDEIRVFEDRIGASLPDDYVSFILEVNGGHAPPSHSAWEFEKRGQRRTATLNSLFSLLEPSDVRNLEERWDLSRNWSPAEVIPIGSAESGSVELAVSGEHRGEIWYLDRVNRRPEESNPRVIWFDRRDVYRLATSFTEFMGMLQPLDSHTRPPPPAGLSDAAKHLLAQFGVDSYKK